MLRGARAGGDRRYRTGFSLIEMLTTVALLVILLGAMVGLARHVREQSAQALTKNLLRRLDGLMTQYADRNDRAVPKVALFPPTGTNAPEGSTMPTTLPAFAPDQSRADQRQLLLRAAMANSRDFVAALRAEPSVGDQPFTEFPVSIYDESQLRDAWGSPIVFMPTKHPWVGTAPLDKEYFFFSAGPDRDYLSHADNLYSYEETVSGR